MSRPIRKPRVTIPRSELGGQLNQAAAIKTEMTELLRELEQTVTHKPIAKPGGWRHDPKGWAERHNPSKST